MENLIAVTAQYVSCNDLQSWIETNGGYWINDSLQQGVIEDGIATVYVTTYDGYFAELDEKEIEALSQRLNEPPKGAVTFTISRNRGSEELADTVMKRFCRDWAAIRAPE